MAQKKKVDSRGLQLLLIIAIFIYSIITLSWISLVLSLIWLFLDYQEFIREDDPY
jgi:hypothetical protein